MGRVFNHNSGLIEKASKVTCPRCKGFGGCVSDKDDAFCICMGDGELWRADSGSGWYKVSRRPMMTSFLY